MKDEAAKKRGLSNRRKGGRVELTLAKKLTAEGVPAAKVPLSGAMAGFPGDIELTIGERKLVAEVKSRKGGAGFVLLERWLGSNDLLFLHRNHAEPLVLMNMSLMVSLLKGRVDG